MKHLRIGIIGFGTLAGAVTAHLAASKTPNEISGYLVRSKEDLDRGPTFCSSIEKFISLGHDVVIECAGQVALREHGVAVITAGIHLVPASIGALVDDTLLKALLPLRSEGRHGQLRLPSGAMVGIDGLAAACHVGVDRVLYRGTMPPHVLKGYCDVPISKGLVYAGSAREAVATFPKNANLTGTIALAGIGFDATRVEMHVDEAATANLHEMHVSGAFGSFEVSVRGDRISAASPSSRIVAGSLVQAALGSNFTLPPSVA